MSIEKIVIEAVEPLLDELVELEKRFEAFQATPGPKGDPGKDAEIDIEAMKSEIISSLEVNNVFEELVELEKRFEAFQATPGPKGDPGKDAEVDVDAMKSDIISSLKANSVLEELFEKRQALEIEEINKIF